MKIAIVGSRDFNNYDYLENRCNKFIKDIKEDIIIVSGGARGVDSLAQEYAKRKGFPILIYYPKWKDSRGHFDRSAGFKRNVLIVDNSDITLAFWDGESLGTRYTIDLATKKGKKVKVYKV